VQNRKRTQTQILQPLQVVLLTLLICVGQITPVLTDGESDLVKSMESNQDSMTSLGYTATLTSQLADLKQLQHEFGEIRSTTQQASFDTSKGIISRIASIALLDGSMTTELAKQTLSLLTPLQAILFTSELSDANVQLTNQHYSEELLRLIPTFTRTYFAGFDGPPNGTVSDLSTDFENANVLVKAGRVVEQNFGPDVKISMDGSLLSGAAVIEVASTNPFATALGAATYRATQKLALASNLIVVDVFDSAEDGCSSCRPSRPHSASPLSIAVTVDLALVPSEYTGQRMLLCGRFSGGKWVYSHLTTVGGRTNTYATCILSSSRPSGSTIVGIFETVDGDDTGDGDDADTLGKPDPDASTLPMRDDLVGSGDSFSGNANDDGNGESADDAVGDGDGEEQSKWDIFMDMIMEKLGWEWPQLVVMGMAAAALLVVLWAVCQKLCCNRDPRRSGKVHPASDPDAPSRASAGTGRSQVVRVAERQQAWQPQQTYNPREDTRLDMNDPYSNVGVESSRSRMSYGAQQPLAPKKARRNSSKR